MRGVYTLPIINITVVNAVVTLGFINPGTTASLGFRRFWVSQSGVTATLQQRVQLVTQPTSFPTLVSQAPLPTAPIDQASKITGNTTGAAGTSGINASAEGAGTKVVVVGDVFNVLTGWLNTLTPDELILMSAGLTSGLGLYFPAAAGTLAGWTAGMTFSEY